MHTYLLLVGILVIFSFLTQMKRIIRNRVIGSEKYKSSIKRLYFSLILYFKIEKTREIYRSASYFEFYSSSHISIQYSWIAFCCEGEV